MDFIILVAAEYSKFKKFGILKNPIKNCLRRSKPILCKAPNKHDLI